MKLNNTGLEDGNWWEERGYEIPKYNIAKPHNIFVSSNCINFKC